MAPSFAPRRLRGEHITETAVEEKGNVAAKTAGSAGTPVRQATAAIGMAPAKLVRSMFHFTTRTKPHDA